MSQPALRELVHEIIDVTPLDSARPNAFASHVEAAILRSRLESTGHSFSDGKVGDPGPRLVAAISVPDMPFLAHR
jgi:hypothetical protein